MEEINSLNNLKPNDITSKSVRVLSGVVVVAKDKTISVYVERKIKHPLYKKVVKKSSKYHAHDEQNTAKVGDKVMIQASKKFSKNKSWVLCKIVSSRNVNVN